MKSEGAIVGVIDAIEALSIDYLVVGALSSNAHGVARSTVDADIVVATDSKGVVSLAKYLGPDFRLDPQISFETITHSRRNKVTYLPTQFEIELFRINDDPHHQSRFARRIRKHLSDINRDAWIPTADDVIIQKLRWARRKDLDDIANVLAVSAKLLDWDYLRHWTTTHGTWELLNQLQSELPDLSVLDDLPE